jgi:hypothetical protein
MRALMCLSAILVTTTNERDLLLEHPEQLRQWTQHILFASLPRS